MLNITFAEADREFAERIQRDMSRSVSQLQKPILIVIISPQAVSDTAVLQAIGAAQNDDTRIVPIIVADAPLPESLTHYPALDFSQRYRKRQLINRLRRVNLGNAKIQQNKRFFIVLMLLMGGVFVAAVAGIVTGWVGFPVEEYALENTERAQMIQDFTNPTLEPLQPRSTEDALVFPQTVEAANTRNAPFLAGTATRQVADIVATSEARNIARTATSAARTTTPE